MRRILAVLAFAACTPASPAPPHGAIDVPIGSASAQPAPVVDAGAPRVAQVIPTTEVVVVLDMSGSMRGIEEVPFGPRPGDPKSPNAATRFDVARSVALRLVDIAERLGKNDYYVGVVVFGADAFVLSAPTTDHAALRALLRKSAIGQIDPNATALSAGILKALSLLDHPRVPSEGDVRDDPTKNDTPRTIVVITDGNVGEAPETVHPLTAARAAASKGVRLDFVVIDDRDEVDVEDGVDLFGKPMRVKAKFPLNRSLLYICATEARGSVIVATDSDALERDLRWRVFPK